MRQYGHTPLPEAADGKLTIRLLTLRPGHRGDDIPVGLTTQVIPSDLTINLDEVVIPEPRWECLSYAWGTVDRSETIYVEVDHDGSDPNNGLATFQVKLNLFAALQELRYTNSNRVLWIDALCIDQRDTNQASIERATQIRAMLEIYQLASRVVIWLGTEGEDSRLALEFLQQLGESFEYDWTSYALKSTQKLQQRTLDLLNDWGSRFSWSTREHRAVCRLFERDWFGRVWTRQEAFAGSQTSLVMCGPSCLSLSDLRNAVQLIGVKGLDVRDPDHENHLHRLEHVLAMLEKRHGSYSTVLDLMRSIRDGHCYLPQDKIYGCLGTIRLTVNKDLADKLPANYPPPLDLFKKFFLAYFELYNTIRILEGGGLCQKSFLGGPSWLPDWTVSLTQLDQRLDCAVSHGMASEAQYDGGDVLTVMGALATKVSKVDVLSHTGDLSSSNVHKTYEELARLMRSHLSCSNEMQLGAFGRALAMPMEMLRVPPEHVQISRGDIEILARSVMEHGDVEQTRKEVEADALHLFEQCLRFYQQHQLPFIFTEDGHVGVSSIGARTGDCVAAVLGMTNLLLLRPRENRFQLVGSCSLHGLNWGEALLGELPADTVVIPQLIPEVGNYLPFYCNNRSGVATFWDPRIDWSELDVKPTDGPSYKIRAPPGDLAPERHVPTSDYFIKRHGAKLERLELI